MTPPSRLRRRRRPTQGELDDRGVRQSEKYYLQNHYSPQAAERMAEEDFQIGQALKGKKKRGLRNVKLTGIEN